MPERPSDGHKGTFGTVIVVGGSSTMLGAPALCATAAFRGGAGLVKIAIAAELIPAVLAIQPSATAMSPEELYAMDVRSNTVLAVGPGMGQGRDERQWVAQLLATEHPIVLDADGLNGLAEVGPGVRWGGGPRVLTPHPGEYRRLAKAWQIDLDPTDPDQRPEAAASLARACESVVLLKGRNTVISDGQRYSINTTGNPALATAGSGDILTGLIAALMAQGLNPFEAARLGAHLHGLAADQWAEQFGPSGMLAMDLADRLPTVINQIR